jgi:hypothetical protein
LPSALAISATAPGRFSTEIVNCLILAILAPPTTVATDYTPHVQDFTGVIEARTHRIVHDIDPNSMPYQQALRNERLNACYRIRLISLYGVDCIPTGKLRCFLACFACLRYALCSYWLPCPLHRDLRLERGRCGYTHHARSLPGNLNFTLPPTTTAYNQRTAAQWFVRTHEGPNYTHGVTFC